MVGGLIPDVCARGVEGRGAACLRPGFLVLEVQTVAAGASCLMTGMEVLATVLCQGCAGIESGFLFGAMFGCFASVTVHV